MMSGNFVSSRHLKNLSPVGLCGSNYLKAIYSVSTERGDTCKVVDLARRMNTTSGAANTMIRKLAGQHYVERAPYSREVTLTDDGTQEALKIIRKHRLYESMAHVLLGMPWESVHEAADREAYYLPDKVCESIDEKLEYPEFDPHGSPIPKKEGGGSDRFIVAKTEGKLLGQRAIGEAGTLQRLSVTSPDMLIYLGELNIGLRSQLCVLEKTPFNGPFIVDVNNERHASIGDELADVMWVG